MKVEIQVYGYVMVHDYTLQTDTFYFATEKSRNESLEQDMAEYGIGAEFYLFKYTKEVEV